ncbi:hypothetical protein Busp01_20150 [Trinickia caryophylli]|uniref:Uncharacterized protein n=1 Tax=Trinickia caryophylli TaxID=28094 RepID=A0A1X7EES9_TRICW|nr:hypothetical protein Busp01_20150 [Trinickia caryophylli]SMF32671.1 hypothetical protein SAMN06295900_105289 [Trinickia caryophylli]
MSDKACPAPNLCRVSFATKHAAFVGNVTRCRVGMLIPCASPKTLCGAGLRAAGQLIGSIGTKAAEVPPARTISGRCVRQQKKTKGKTDTAG